jgi:hypothetical protein
MKRREEDTRAILDRREAFVKGVLSSNEIGFVKGGEDKSPQICLSPHVCLKI